jgi:orotidine 5'-phosphate decarboxylase subfamily 1
MNESGGRVVSVKNVVSRRLMELMLRKRSNLIAALDVTAPLELLRLAREVGPEVCAVKLHLNILDFSSFSRGEFESAFAKVKDAHDFLVIADDKLADIGAIMAMQVERLPAWVDMVTVHGITGEPAVAEIDRLSREIGVLLVHQLSCQGNLIDPSYSAAVERMLRNCRKAVGAVTQTPLPGVLSFCPGINLDSKTDGQGQQYRDPASLTSQLQPDLFIVGRGICLASDPAAAARRYRAKCWPAVPPRADFPTAGQDVHTTAATAAKVLGANVFLAKAPGDPKAPADLMPAKSVVSPVAVEQPEVKWLDTPHKLLLAARDYRRAMLARLGAPDSPISDLIFYESIARFHASCNRRIRAASANTTAAAQVLASTKTPGSSGGTGSTPGTTTYKNASASVRSGVPPGTLVSALNIAHRLDSVCVGVCVCGEQGWRRRPLPRRMGL